MLPIYREGSQHMKQTVFGVSNRDPIKPILSDSHTVTMLAMH